MPAQVSGAEKPEAYLSSDLSSDYLENHDIFNQESKKDDSSNEAKKKPMSIEEFNERNRRLQMKEGNEALASIVFNYKKHELIFFSQRPLIMINQGHVIF